MERKKASPPDGKCQAKTKSGEPCRAHAVRGKRYCSLHLTPSRASEIGRKGGQKNRRVNANEILKEPFAIPQNNSDVVRTLRECLALTVAGRLSPSQASAVGYLATVLARVQEAEEFEKRLMLLEKKHRELLEDLPVSSVPALPPNDPDPEEKEAASKSSKPC